MAKPWTRDDALLVLASHLDRPRGMSLPPRQELERLGNLLRRPVDDVLEQLQAFALIAAGGEGNKRDQALWDEFSGDALGCAIAADDVLQERRRVPYHLRKRLDQP